MDFHPTGWGYWLSWFWLSFKRIEGPLTGLPWVIPWVNTHLLSSFHKENLHHIWVDLRSSCVILWVLTALFPFSLSNLLVMPTGECAEGCFGQRREYTYLLQDLGGALWFPSCLYLYLGSGVLDITMSSVLRPSFSSRTIGEALLNTLLYYNRKYLLITFFVLTVLSSCIFYFI